MISFSVNQISELIWAKLFLPALLILSLTLSFGCKWFQFRKFGTMLKETIGRAFDKNKGSRLSSFQAASTALGSTIGTGNIIGTAQALAMGGPGALFWLWIAGLIAMIVKYAEILLALHFRTEKRAYGPMDYIETGLNSKRLAVIYGFLALCSSLLMGNMTQAGSISLAFVSLACSFISGLNHSAIKLAMGFTLGALTLIITSGGIKRIGRCAELTVPFMALIFIILSCTVIALNINRLPYIISLVINEAFNPGSMCAGAAGISTAQCIRWGIRRSAFSNEAGLGTSAIAHASAETDSAPRQALWGIFEVFADTIVICSCTALCILCTDTQIPFGTICGPELFQRSLSSVIGPGASAAATAAFLAIFAYTSIMGWAMYGTQCSQYLWGSKSEIPYSIIFSLLLVIGSVTPTETLWQMSDFINALMSLPNLYALITLSPLIIRISRDTFS